VEKPAGKDGTMRLIARYKDGVLQPYETLDLPDERKWRFCCGCGRAPSGGREFAHGGRFQDVGA